MKTVKIMAVIVAVVLATIVSGPLRSAWADPALDAAKRSSKTIESVLHEMGHALQQGQKASSTVGAATTGPTTTRLARTESTGSSRTATGKADDQSSNWVRVAQAHAMDDAAKLIRLSDKVLIETRKLEKIYRNRDLKDGLGHVRAIASEADRIKKLARDLGSAPTPSGTKQFYKRVSERLRHKNRAHDGHKKWIEILSSSSSASQGKAGEEIYTDEHGRVKSQFSKDRQGKSAFKLSKKRSGDPDRPFVTGRVYTDAEKETGTRKVEMEKVRISSVSAGSGGAKDRPSESISLNYTQVRMSSTSVHGTYEYDSRLLLLGKDKRIYALPNGTYIGKDGSKINVRGANLMTKSSGSVVLKGSKINENTPGSGETTSGSLTGRRTYEPLTIRPSKRELSANGSGHRKILPIRLSVKSPGGKYTGPSGAWFELKGENIVEIGGSLHRHNPPPFLDVSGDGGTRGPGGSSKGNVEMEFKVEKGE
jgi:hypothetical protein